VCAARELNTGVSAELLQLLLVINMCIKLQVFIADDNVTDMPAAAAAAAAGHHQAHQDAGVHCWGLCC
jgi:hypothetical protein